jgi:hypothetical protein
VKARRVKGLDPDGELGANAYRIVAVRLGELEALGPPALEHGEAGALHDMRIASKRLRYVLEMAAPALGEAALKGAKTAKALQDVLGEIHDCDEMLPRIAARIARLRAADADALRAAAGDGAKDLDPATAAEAPNLTHYRGLEALSAYLTARRAVLFERVSRQWADLEPQGFAELLEAISDARAPGAPTDGAAP